MPTPTLSVIKRLFALSGNRCAFPGCDLPLVEKSGTVTGQVCHIHGISSQGPRFDPTQSEAECHAFHNLILMCSRHHAVIDSEPDRYSPELLRTFKLQHERGDIGLSPDTERVARVLLQNLTGFHIHNNSGSISINSPGSIQTNSLSIKSAKQPKVTISPPDHSVGQARAMSSYVDYLIQRYNDYQKADVEKSGNFKYMAIHNAIRREFGCRWQFVGQEDFDRLVNFLRHRINRTKLGRIQNARGHKNYHSFEEHSA